MSRKAFIAGCKGPTLDNAERSFFEKEQPWGFILFARNCSDAEQIRSLSAALRDTIDGQDVPIFIDQEGGRVSRLRPPLIPDYPPGAVYGDLFQNSAATGERAAWLAGRLIASDLAGVGVDGNCVPIVDVRQDYTDGIIGNRAYGWDPQTVSRIGRQIAAGSLAGGVLPVVKHVPGHGRARQDSHLALPVVDDAVDVLRAVDFAPFHDLRDLPLAMTAHIVYSAIDPAAPATLSSTVIGDVIRGEIGFDGALMTDDLSMKALSGSMSDRAARSLEAGCDLVLHCNGDMAEMAAVAAAVPELSGDAKRRVANAFAQRSGTPDEAVEALRSEFNTLLEGAVSG